MTHMFSSGGGRTLMSAGSPVLAADEFLLVADTLQIQAGTDIVIASHVNYLTILAREITVGAGAWIVWEPDRDARAGRDAARRRRRTVVRPVHRERLLGLHEPVGRRRWTRPRWQRRADAWASALRSSRSGRSRSTGCPRSSCRDGSAARATGAGGGDGGDGCKGAHSKAVVFCTDGPGWGGDGGDGGDGGRGGRGGPGGRGGNVTFLTTDACHEADAETGFTINIAGGPAARAATAARAAAGAAAARRATTRSPARPRPSARARTAGTATTAIPARRGHRVRRASSAPSSSPRRSSPRSGRRRRSAPSRRCRVAIGDTVTIDGRQLRRRRLGDLRRHARRDDLHRGHDPAGRGARRPGPARSTSSSRSRAARSATPPACTSRRR